MHFRILNYVKEQTNKENLRSKQKHIPLQKPPCNLQMDPRWICGLDSQNSITRELHTILGAYTTPGPEGSKNKS